MKKRAANKVLGLTVFILFFFLASSSLAAEYVSVSKDGVNLRSGPGTDREILWEVFKGFPLQVIARKGKWVHTVDFEGDKGWLYAPLASQKKTVIVKVNLANMRLGPGTNYEIVARVKYGVVFTPVDSKGDWVKVKHQDGTTGWISKDLLWPGS
jgi:SH3-like domain-containing protein